MAPYLQKAHSYDHHVMDLYKFSSDIRNMVIHLGKIQGKLYEAKRAWNHVKFQRESPNIATEHRDMKTCDDPAFMGRKITGFDLVGRYYLQLHGKKAGTVRKAYETDLPGYPVFITRWMRHLKIGASTECKFRFPDEHLE